MVVFHLIWGLSFFHFVAVLHFFAGDLLIFVVIYCSWLFCFSFLDFYNLFMDFCWVFLVSLRLPLCVTQSNVNTLTLHERTHAHSFPAFCAAFVNGKQV